jgi:hypothetical protein
MALMSFIAKNVKRSSGKSIIAAIAYRTGERLTSVQGEVFDFTPRQRVQAVAHSQIFLPENSPDWGQDREKLWNAADSSERRKDAVTGREFVLNLPHELDDQQRIALVSRFAKTVIERHGCAVDAAIHRPDRRGDQRNHHCHMMLTTRRLTNKGFGEKTRELDTKKDPALEKCRELWADYTNQALAAAGHGARIDHRSYKRQGIDKLPQLHMGSYNMLLERDNIRTPRGNYNRKIKIINALKAAPLWTFAGWTRQQELAQQAAVQRAEIMQKAQAEAQRRAAIAKDVQETRKQAITAQEAQEVVVRQAEDAKRAKIDDLRAKERGLRRDMMDVIGRTIAAEDRIANDPNSKYDDNANDELRITYAPVEDKAYRAWVVAIRELEKLDLVKELEAEDRPKKGLLGRLFGKEEPHIPETFNECIAFANERRPKIKAWLQENEAERAINAKRDVERTQQNALDNERRAEAAERERLRVLENERIRAENVAKRDAPSADNKPRPRPDDDSPSPF